MSGEVDNEDGELLQRKKRKLHTHEKAQLAYKRAQKEKEDKKLLAEERNRQKLEAVKKSKALKKRKLKMLYKKTKRGQPKLGHQVEFLLEKIKRQCS